jgi:hypothetical protein
MLLTLMMAPLPRSAMPGANPATTVNGTATLRVNMASKSAGSRFSVGAHADNPALLTTTSSGPDCSIRRATSAGSVRSAAMNRALPPPVTICVTNT